MERSRDIDPGPITRSGPEEGPLRHKKVLDQVYALADVLLVENVDHLLEYRQKLSVEADFGTVGISETRFAR
jgi:hypothetical protein